MAYFWYKNTRYTYNITWNTSSTISAGCIVTGLLGLGDRGGTWTSSQSGHSCKWQNSKLHNMIFLKDSLLVSVFRGYFSFYLIQYIQKSKKGIFLFSLFR